MFWFSYTVKKSAGFFFIENGIGNQSWKWVLIALKMLGNFTMIMAEELDLGCGNNIHTRTKMV